MPSGNTGSAGSVGNQAGNPAFEGLISKYKERLESEFGQKRREGTAAAAAQFESGEFTSSREYKEFKQSFLPRHLSVYESLCHLSGKLFLIKPKNRDFLASIGSLGGETANDRVVIPYTAFQARYGLRDLPVIQAQAVSIDQAETAARQARELLSLRHDGQFTYHTETMKQYIDTTNKVVGVA